MPRRLRPDEEALWRRVASHATPLHPHRPEPQSQPPASWPRHAPPAKHDPPQPVLPFRIGEAAAPDPAPRPFAGRPPPLRLDRRTQKDLSRGKRTPDASIDLHGMTLAQAHAALTRFVLASFATRRRLILVITGKGQRGDEPWDTPRGLLRRQVPDWLASPPLGSVVQEVLPAHRSHGGSGAYYVVLRRN